MQLDGELRRSESRPQGSTNQTSSFRSSSRWQSLLENMREGFLLGETIRDPITGLAVDFRVIETNPAFGKHTGLSPKAVIGRTALEVVPDFQQDLIAKFAHVAETGECLEIEVDVPALGGRWYEARVQPADGPGRFAVLFFEITARKLAETALRASECRMRELVATLDLASVIVRDPDGTIQAWTRGCERLYGWRSEDAVGSISHELLRTGFPIPRGEIEAALLRDGEWNGDLIQRTRDGREITVAARQVLRRDDTGQPVAVMESVSDVTALRTAQQELHQLNRDLEARVRQEVASREEAQTKLARAERMHALGQLAGGIAHDFNNVVQAVQASLELVRNRAGNPEDVHRFAGMALSSAARGAAITQRLLAFVRHSDLRAEPIEVSSLLEELRDILAHSLGAGIHVRIEVAKNLPPLVADRGQLETVLVNLATNGRDAMPRGGTLTISAGLATVSGDANDPAELPSGHYLRLAISDTGTGMNEATAAQALEPFFTTKKDQGTGLGLPIAKSFAEQSGGALAIESALGRGTTVSLFLPQELPKAIGGQQSPATAQAVSTAPSQAKPGRVLLVDDDEIVRETLAVQLEDAGFTVLKAASGEQALTLLQTSGPADALVTDLSMPGLDGLALIRLVQERHPNMPAVLLTGYVGDGAAHVVGRALEGPFLLLRKPIAGTQLADHIAMLVTAKPLPHRPAPQSGSRNAEVAEPAIPRAVPTKRPALAAPNPIFKSAYDAAVTAIGEHAWSHLPSSEQTRAIYREMRRIDREAAQS